ncbi:MAG: ribonuclease III [Desulfovibrionaceae bacterium]|nr:ribonuclease III [Desulfovibrionaceae bacterium]MBF0512996.1 ribonuclease III [Desulfovibrionaceae bacterium]
MDAAILEQAFHHAFAQVKLLEEALTHSSFANELGTQDPGSFGHNERLEFLGDAVLELVVSAELFRRFPEASEGALTRLRAKLVNESSLAGQARRLGLQNALRLGKGEEIQGGRERDALLADALEAVIAAVFLDGGFAAAQKTVLAVFASRWPASAETPKVKDHKSALQELTQERHGARPVYHLTGSSGPEHAKMFHVTLTLPDGQTFTSQGPSLKKAEQRAAKAALAATAHPGEASPPPDPLHRGR